MAELNFPFEPAGHNTGTQYTADNGMTYVWDGNKWIGHSTSTAPGTNSITNNGYVVQVDQYGNLVIPTTGGIKRADGTPINGINDQFLNTFNTVQFNGLRSTATIYQGTAFDGVDYSDQSIRVDADTDSYAQMIMINHSTGTNASTDLVIMNDQGDDFTNLIDLGINGSNYEQVAYSVTAPGDGYLFTNGGNLVVGTQSPNAKLVFHAGGTTESNAGGYLDQYAWHFNRSANVTVTVANPLNFLVRNESNSANASSNFISQNDQGVTIKFGVNSSQRTDGNIMQGEAYINTAGAFDTLHIGNQSTINFYSNQTTGYSGTPTLQLSHHDQVATFYGHVVPMPDAVQDLGTSTQEWRNLYLSGAININGQTIISTGSFINLAGVSITNGDLTHGPTALLNIPVNGTSNDLALVNTYGNTVINEGTGSQWTFGIDGTTVLPSHSEYATGQTAILVDNTAIIYSNSSKRGGIEIRAKGPDGDSSWVFNSDGNLTLPDTTLLGNGALAGSTGNSLKIKTDGSGGSGGNYWYNVVTDIDIDQGFSYGVSSTYDSAGNLYVLSSILWGMGILPTLFKYTPAGDLVWSKDIDFNISVGESIEYSNGFLYVLLTCVSGNSSVGVIKLDTDGNIISQSMGDSTVGLNGIDLTVDPNGNVYVLAETSTTYFITGGTANAVVKLDSSLTFQWAAGITDAAYTSENFGYGYGAITADNSYVYVTGASNDGLLASNSNWTWLGKWDTNGNNVWFKQFNVNGLDAGVGTAGEGICLDPSGNIYTTSISLMENGSTTIVKFDTDGTFIWGSIIDWYQGGGDVDINYANGNIHLTGVQYYGPFGPTRIFTSAINDNYGGLHWATLNATTGALVFEQVFDYVGSFVSQLDVGELKGHRISGIYNDVMSLTGYVLNDVTSTATTTASITASIITLQIPLTAATTGSYGMFEIIDITQGSSTSTSVESGFMNYNTSTQVSTLTSSFGGFVSGIATTTSTMLTFNSTHNIIGRLNVWEFTPEAGLMLPTGGTIVFPDRSSQTTAYPGPSSTLTNGLYSLTLDTNGVVNIPVSSFSTAQLFAAGSNTLMLGNSSHYLQVRGSDGALVFNDYTVQTTAWTGVVSTLTNSGYNITVDAHGLLNLSTAGTIVGNDSGTDVKVVATDGLTTSTWAFGKTGAVTFPDNTVQTSAYQKVSTGWDQQYPSISLDNFAAAIDNAGNPTVAAVSGTFNCAFTLQITQGNGTSWDTTTAGDNGAVFTSLFGSGIGVTFQHTGAMVVGTFCDTDNGRVYKVTWIAGPTGPSTGYGSIIIEKLI